MTAIELEPLEPADPNYQPPESRDQTSCFCCPSQDQGDLEDGWTTGGRAPASSKEELKYFIRCESLCCSTGVGNKLYENGITRCFCCFDCCFGFVQRHLISDGREGLHSDPYTNRMEETEEWFRGFNCWPLPLLTLIMCSIETYYFVMFSNADNYVNALLATDLAWTPTTKNETHRLVST